MSTKVIQGEMSITRDNHNMINIRAQCSSSNAHFLDVLLTPEQFAMMVTGCHTTDLTMTVRGLDLVGKLRIREPRQIVCPIDCFRREDSEKWLVENGQEEGWILDSSLRSQSSIQRVGKEAILSYSVHKYVDNEGE